MKQSSRRKLVHVGRLAGTRGTMIGVPGRLQLSICGWTNISDLGFLYSSSAFKPRPMRPSGKENDGRADAHLVPGAQPRTARRPWDIPRHHVVRTP